MTVCGGGSVAAYRVHGPVVRTILGRMQRTVGARRPGTMGPDCSGGLLLMAA